jgi:hypothetical protein
MLPTGSIPQVLPLEVHRMGKTLPPFSQLIEAERRRWAPFKKTLLKADQVAFERLFDGAKLHMQAGVMPSRPWACETIIMAVLLEHEQRIARLVDALQALTSQESNPPSGDGLSSAS